MSFLTGIKYNFIRNNIAALFAAEEVCPDAAHKTNSGSVTTQRKPNPGLIAGTKKMYLGF